MSRYTATIFAAMDVEADSVEEAKKKAAKQIDASELAELRIGAECVEKGENQ